MLLTRTMTIGSGRPTGPAMPKGRGASLGRVGAPTLAASLQPLLSVYEQFERSGGLEPGSLSAHLSHAGELSHGVRRLSDMADKRHAESVGGSLPQVAPRPAYRRARRCAPGHRGKAFAGAHARQGGDGAGIEHAGAVGAGKAFSGIARSDYSAGLARFGIHGNSAGALGARRYGKIAHQSRAHRAGAHPAGDGSAAVVGLGSGK